MWPHRAWLPLRLHQGATVEGQLQRERVGDVLEYLVREPVDEAHRYDLQRSLRWSVPVLIEDMA